MAMLNVSVFLWAILVSAFVAADSSAQNLASPFAESLAKLKSRPITLAMGKHSVNEVLLAIEKQTGNRVVDRRSKDAIAAVVVGFDSLTFWQALDRLCDALDAHVSPYTEDGVGILDGKKKPGPRVDQGICRLEMRRISVTRDQETEMTTCTILLNLAWEPRFEPLYLTLGPLTGSYSEAQAIVLRFTEQSREAQPIAKRTAVEMDLRIPGPERRVANLGQLTGSFRFLGPGEMLSFSFPGEMDKNTKALGLDKDGVHVSVSAIMTSRKSWSVDVAIQNPEGTPGLQSFQSWLDNNRIHLERTKAGQREVWSPRPEDEQVLSDPTSRSARIRYVFGSAEGKGDPSEWTLVYRTPGPMVELNVPFEFRNVPLP